MAGQSPQLPTSPSQLASWRSSVRERPLRLKLFLTTVAIVDDLGAVAIIAVAYTSSIDTVALGVAAAIWFVMYAIGKSGVVRLWPYLILAVGLWYAVLLSGVHATVAGVLAAAAIPVIGTRARRMIADSPLHRLEHALAPWVAFAVVPLFGFANAGVSLAGIGLAQLLAPLPLAIAAGLFLGKQLGIFAAVRLCCGMGSRRHYGAQRGCRFTESRSFAASASP